MVAIIGLLSNLDTRVSEMVTDSCSCLTSNTVDGSGMHTLYSVQKDDTLRDTDYTGNDIKSGQLLDLM